MAQNRQHALVDKTVEEEGDKVMALIEDVRRKKAALKLPLNIPILSLEVYTGNQANADLINSSKNDIAGTLKVVGDFKVIPQSGSRTRSTTVSRGNSHRCLRGGN